MLWATDGSQGVGWTHSGGQGQRFFEGLLSGRQAGDGHQDRQGYVTRLLERVMSVISAERSSLLGAGRRRS